MNQLERKLIMANWKMNKTREEAHNFFQQFQAKNLKQNRDVVICPPFTSLAIAREYADEGGFTVGAQNFHPEPNGAFTGEISAAMLNEIGVRVVLAGHSERRTIFNETDTMVNKKVLTALKNDLYVCLCIGETLTERESNKTNSILSKQLEIGLGGVELPIQDTYLLSVAYEPVWAIGTGKVATLDQIKETHKFIKSELEKMYPGVLVPVLYGGSVNEKNASEILAIHGVDGVLVGGASLDPDKFAAIINA